MTALHAIDPDILTAEQIDHARYNCAPKPHAEAVEFVFSNDSESNLYTGSRECYFGVKVLFHGYRIGEFVVSGAVRPGRENIWHVGTSTRYGYSAVRNAPEFNHLRDVREWLQQNVEVQPVINW